jgi:hypothetical protein
MITRAQFAGTETRGSMSVRTRLTALAAVVVAAVIGLFATAASTSAAPPYTHHPHIACTPFHPLVGTHITCDGDGYLHNDHVVITLHSKTYTLGSVNTNAAGAFTGKVLQLPPHVIGLHTVTGTGRGGPVTDSASTLEDPVAPNGTQGQGTGGGGVSTTGVAVIAMGVLGVGLVVAGTMFLLSARRRKALV